MANELSQLETLLLARLAPLANQPVIFKAFSSLDDITLAGTQSPEGVPVSIVLTVVTGGVFSPNTYTIAVNGGASGSPQDMTTGPVSIGNGFTAQFASVTGHTAGDTCIIQNGPCRVIQPWLFDGSEQAFMEITSMAGVTLPIGILASPTTQEDPFQVKGAAGAQISYVSNWNFYTIYTDNTGTPGGDPNYARRQWYYDVKRRADVCLDDRPVDSTWEITTPHFRFDQIVKYADSYFLAPDSSGIVTRHSIGVKCRGECTSVI